MTCCTMQNTYLLSALNSKSYLQLKQPLPRIFRYVELDFGWFIFVNDRNRKTMNSSLSFGQAAVTFCLPGPLLARLSE